MNPRPVSSFLLIFLVSLFSGCGANEGIPLSDSNLTDSFDESKYELVTRFAHITDAHIVDEESPGRLTALAGLNAFAWRPHEKYSVHSLDGIIRVINRFHQAVKQVDFVLHTGDAVDNAQANELAWFIDCFEGKLIDPLTGRDDRLPEDRGPVLLDPHRPFQAEGLYLQGNHGERPSISWYSAVGNHDRYAIGIFPILPSLFGGLHALLPVSNRIGLFLPTSLVPDGGIAYGPITPAYPGPPPDVVLPSAVTPNPDRHFVTGNDFLNAHFNTMTEPNGHGFSESGETWYSVTPAPGVRLIVLDTSIPSITLPAGIYDSGAIVTRQLQFLVDQLDLSRDANEIVIVATHHPSFNILPSQGSAVNPEQFRDLLRTYPNVVAHLAGHSHRHRVWDRQGYLEFETGSIMDYPQEGRMLEIWRNETETILRYSVFSTVYEGSAFEGTDSADIEDDPYLPMRRKVLEIARKHSEINHLLPIFPSAGFQPPVPYESKTRPQKETDRTGSARFNIIP